MKKQKNATRIIAIVLVLLMALALVPIAASADAAPTEGECTITFDANGGNTLGTGQSATQTYTMGDVTVLNGNPFTDGTRTFSGWNTHADATAEGAEAVADGASVSVLSSLTTWVGNEITLYAQWVPQYTVTFDANGGSGTYSSTQDINTAATFPPDATFSREGYRFDGWKDEGGLSYTSYTTSTPNAAVTLYAQWVQRCTVTYDAKGGTFTSGSASVTVDKGASSGDLPTVTKTNCTFDGWYNGTTKVTEPFTVDADTTLDAKWTGASVTVAFKPGAASGTDNTFTWLYGEANSLIDNPFTAPDKTIFDGWQVAGGSKQQAGETLVWPEGVYNTLDITAQWADCWRIDFNAHGGSISPSSVLVPQGTAIGEQLKDPTAPTGKTFNGWYTTADYAEDGKVDSTWVPASDRTLHAKWLSNTITFKFEPGDGATGTKDDVSVTRGDTYTAPTTCTEFTKTNYVFAGWKNKADSSDFTSLDTDNDTPDTVTLVAQWKLDAVTVTLDANGGTGSASATMYRSAARSLPSLDSTGITAPTGSVFLGWVTDTAHTTPDFLDGASIQWNGAQTTDPNYAGDTNAVTLYALWQEQLKGTVTVKYKNGTEISGTEVKINDELKASVTIEAPTGIDPTKLYYRWRCGDNVLAGGQNATEYTVDASLFGKQIFCEVSNDPQYSCVIKSGNYSVSAEASSLCDLTVTVTAGGTCTVKINDTAYTDFTSPIKVVKESTVKLQLQPQSGMHPTAITLPDGTTYSGSVALLYPSVAIPDAPTCALSITLAANTGTTPKASENAGADTSAARAKILNTAATSTVPASRIKIYIADIIAFWDDNPANRLTQEQITANKAKLGFNLPYPDSAKKPSARDISSDPVTDHYTVAVWHYKADGTAVQVTGVTIHPEWTKGVDVPGQDDYSPYAVTLSPLPLDGTVSFTGTTSGKASFGKPVTAVYTPKAGSPDPAGTLSYQWVRSETETGTGTLISGATGKSYTPVAADRGKYLNCIVKSDVETGEVTAAKGVPVAREAPSPVQKQYVINNANSAYSFPQAGIIGNLSDEMQYNINPSSSSPAADDGGWRDVVAGKTESGGLTEGGTYWVRFKDDKNYSSNWAKVTIDEYYTVTAVPDSVSTNRLYFTASGSYPELIAGKVWLVPKGKSINVTANSGNTNYYKITQLRTKNLKTDYVTVRTINKANTGSTGSFTVNAPYYVSATAGVYGSKTGDTSHLELWVELAALSLMGLGAALVIGRKKLKAQK